MLLSATMKGCRTSARNARPSVRIGRIIAPSWEDVYARWTFYALNQAALLPKYRTSSSRRLYPTQRPEPRCFCLDHSVSLAVVLTASLYNDGVRPARRRVRMDRCFVCSLGLATTSKGGEAGEKRPGHHYFAK
jgi:hypothetical protein